VARTGRSTWNTKIWSDTLRPDNTESRALQRETRAIGGYGAWRIIKSVASDQEKSLEVSKRKKTVAMSYSFEAEREIKAFEIGMEDTARGILGKLKIEEHVIADGKAAILTAVHDVVSWAHTTELGVEKKRSVRSRLYANEAAGLKPVIRAGNPKTDERPEFWGAYNKILDALRL
jgi:hypothetical protein